MLTEIDKLTAVRAVGLPADLFADVAPGCGGPGWRARAAVESPSHLRGHPGPTRLTLLAALLSLREREITDTLVELLTSTAHRERLEHALRRHPRAQPFVWAKAAEEVLGKANRRTTSNTGH